MTAAARFEAVELPSHVADALLERLAAGKPASSLVVHWRDRSAVVVDRGTLAGRLRREGLQALSQLVLRAVVTRGRVLVLVDVARGCNVTLATLPKRTAPPVLVVAPEPERTAAFPNAGYGVSHHAEPVIVQPRRRAQVARVRSVASAQYRRELDAVTRRPGVPRGRTSP